MTDQELKDLVKSLALAQKETDRLMKETDSQMKATDRQIKELGERIDALYRNTIEQGKQIGGLGNRFGDFAEGMALPSLIDILSKKFSADQILETRWIRKGEEEIEFDLIGATNGQKKTVVVAEVKSSLNRRELDKFIHNLHRFFHFFPQFKGYKLFGVLAAVSGAKELDAQASAAGLCVARMQGEVFRLNNPPDFTPKDFAPKAA